MTHTACKPSSGDWTTSTSAACRRKAIAQYREFLDQAKGQPFALQLCFSDPHRPLDANAIPVPHDPNKIKLPARYPDTPGVREDFAKYYDEISRFDGNFALVLEELKKRGLSDNTIVVVMGDNGFRTLAALVTSFRLRPVLGDFQHHRWQVEDLPPVTADHRTLGQRNMAAPAPTRRVHLQTVRVLDLPQRRTLVSQLPAGALA